MRAAPVIRSPDPPPRPLGQPPARPSVGVPAWVRTGLVTIRGAGLRGSAGRIGFEAGHGAADGRKGESLQRDVGRLVADATRGLSGDGKAIPGMRARMRAIDDALQQLVGITARVAARTPRPPITVSSRRSSRKRALNSDSAMERAGAALAAGVRAHASGSSDDTATAGAGAGAYST